MERIFIAAGERYSTRENHVPAPFFRKVFGLGKGKCRSVSIRVVTTGLYRIFLNGKEFTKGMFAPYISNPDHLVYYDEYDITGMIADTNILCILSGNGFGNAMDSGVWGFEKAEFRSTPKLSCTLFADGKEIFSLDEKCEVYDSPVLFDDIRCGERYDARLERKELLTDASLCGDRYAILVSPPEGDVKKCMAPPVKRFEEIKAACHFKSGKGFIYDFGINSAGICRLTLNGIKGQKITINYGEILQDGKLDKGNITFPEMQSDYVQHDEYICNGGFAVWTPSFTYHGFRYAYIEGITDAQATDDLLVYIIVHSDVPQAGRFLCGNETVNKIQSCVLNSDLSNMVCIPTDCPQREKNGWTGDTFLSAEQFLMNFDCCSMLREWLCNIRKAQTAEGALPGIVPTAGFGYEWGNGPAWDGALIEITYQIYRFTGDKTVIEENEKAIALYFDYLKTKINDDGLISFGLGDWCQAGTLCEWNYSTPVEVTDTLICVYLAKKAEVLFEATGNTDNDPASFYKELIKNFRKKYLKDDGTLVSPTQTALALSITCGVFKGHELPEACSSLRALINNEGRRLKTGVIGARFLFDVLAGAGYSDLALDLITGPDFPSYGYLLEHGATSLWEGFFELSESDRYFKRKDNGKMLSLNHHFWGSVSAWFYKYPAGIRIISDGCVKIAPCFSEKIKWVKARRESGDKNISIFWEIDNREVNLEIISAGYSGEIDLNGSGYVFEDLKNKKTLKYGNHFYVLHKI